MAPIREVGLALGQPRFDRTGRAVAPDWRPSADRLHQPGSAGPAPAMVTAGRGERRKWRQPACLPSMRANQSTSRKNSCRLCSSSRALPSMRSFPARRCGSSRIRRRLVQSRLTFHCHHARVIHDLRGVKDGIGALEGGKRLVTGLPDRRQNLEAVPGCIVTSRQGFADPRRSIAQADIAIVPTGIAELGEAAIFAGDQERTGVIHSDIA